MEVAAFLSDKAGTISVVEREEFPYQHALGPQVGGVAMKVRKTWGPGNLAPVLSHNSACPASVLTHELCTHGCSQSSPPQTSFLHPKPISHPSPDQDCREKPGFQHMQTNIPNVFAAGDVVTFPVALLDGDSSSIRHQQVAEAHGRCAALNMLRRGKELHTVPYFWSTLLGKSIRYAGRKGQREGNRISSHQLGLGLKFLIFYIRDGHVTAAASLNCDPMVSLIAEVFWWVALCCSPYQQSPLRDTKPRGVTVNPQPISCFQGL
uniref:Uncharacterized protein n=1 Tax=Catharus ustulatus TaxID=91951 RepID=A0A8C3Y3A0_CATUS